MPNMRSSEKFFNALGLTLSSIKKSNQHDLWSQIFDYCIVNNVALIFDNNCQDYLLGSFKDLNDDDQENVVDDFCLYIQQIVEEADNAQLPSKKDREF